MRRWLQMLTASLWTVHLIDPDSDRTAELLDVGIDAIALSSRQRTIALKRL
jgi:hypothetical protein